MSQENVEIVKAALEAWNAGDMDAFRELYDANAILQTPEGWPKLSQRFSDGKVGTREVR